MLRRLQDYLSKPVSVQSLAATRMLFGAIILWDVWSYIKHTRIDRYYVQPDILFPYFELEWIQPFSPAVLYILWLTLGLLSLFVMVGFRYRFSIIGLTAIFTYFFLLDRSQYLNHHYMIILYAVLLCFMPAHKAYSMDARRRPEWRSEFIPNWPVATLRLQTEIILIYAGIVKITGDWLQGEPLRMWISDKLLAVPFGFLFQYDWAILAGAWGTIVLHIVGAPLLLWERTRFPVFMVYCVFHMTNAALFNIGVFPWLTIAITLIFFAPDWPRRLARWSLSKFEELPPPPKVDLPELPRIGTAAFVALTIWFSVQIVLPQRQAFFPTDVKWTGDGHRFSWRMRIYDRDAEARFRIVDPESGQVWEVEPRDYLSRRQARIAMTRPDTIHNFVRKLEGIWLEDGYPDVEIYADIQKSLNGRAFQTFIDPDVDLTNVRYNYFGTDDWVLPLTTPLKGTELASRP